MDDEKYDLTKNVNEFHRIDSIINDGCKSKLEEVDESNGNRVDEFFFQCTCDRFSDKFN